MDAIFRIEREKQNFLFYKEYENDSSISGFHSHLELYFVDDGEMDITVNSHYRKLKKGEMCVVLSFDSHAYATKDYSKSSVLIIPLYLCGEFTEFVKNKTTLNPFITDKKVVSKIKRYIKLLNGSSKNEILQKGYIYTVLGLVAENIDFCSDSSPFDPSLSSRLLTYIYDHFREDLTLKSLSQSLGYNENYLSRYFSSSFKISFSKYLSTVRLKNVLLLMHEGKSLTEAAFDSGFNSIRTFYRSFKAEFGVPPKEYIALTKHPED